MDLSKLLNELVDFISGKKPSEDRRTQKTTTDRSSTEFQSSKSSGSFGAKVLANARADLGFKENLGKNDGTRIREYFKYFNAKSGQEWCAAAISAWMKEAGGGPIAGSLGARQIGSQFQSAGKWVSKKDLTSDDLAPGNIAVFSRGESGSGLGHVGVISSSNKNGNFTSIEGNSGPKGDSGVTNSHSIHSDNLLGVGILSDYIPVKKANKQMAKEQKSVAMSINEIEKLADRYYRLTKC